MRGVVSTRVDALSDELAACPPMAGRALVDEVAFNLTPSGAISSRAEGYYETPAPLS